MAETEEGRRVRRGPGLLLLLGMAPFRNAYLRRGAAVWVGVRTAAAFAGLRDVAPLASAFIVGVSAWLVLLDARRRSEDLFLANLGVSSAAIVACALPLPLVAEVIVGALWP